MSDLVGIPEDRFYRILANMVKLIFMASCFYFSPYFLDFFSVHSQHCCFSVIHYSHLQSLLSNVPSASFLQETNTKKAITRENRSSGFPTRANTNRSVQPQKNARSLKFRI